MVRYNEAEGKAYEVLLKYSDGTLPINPFQIVSKVKNIKLKTYREFARELQKKAPELSTDEIIATFESEHGFLMKKGNKKYILCYNDLQPILTVRWTLFHELGHYFLSHLKESTSSSSFACEGELIYSKKEKEANCFARHCSCPLPLFSYATALINCEVNNIFLFRSLFWVSHSSSCYTLDHFFKFRKYYPMNKEERLIKHFGAAIYDKTRTIQHLHGVGY